MGARHLPHLLLLLGLHVHPLRAHLLRVHLLRVRVHLHLRGRRLVVVLVLVVVVVVAVVAGRQICSVPVVPSLALGGPKGWTRRLWANA